LDAYVQISVNVPSDKEEALIGLLSGTPLVSVWQDEGTLHAFYNQNTWTPDVKESVSSIVDYFDLNYKETIPDNINWTIKTIALLLVQIAS